MLADAVLEVYRKALSNLGNVYIVEKSENPEDLENDQKSLEAGRNATRY